MTWYATNYEYGWMIGRLESCEIRINQKHISNQHVQIFCDEHGVRLVD